MVLFNIYLSNVRAAEDGRPLLRGTRFLFPRCRRFLFPRRSRILFPTEAQSPPPRLLQLDVQSDEPVVPYLPIKATVRRSRSKARRRHPGALVARGLGESDVGEALVLTTKRLANSSRRQRDLGGKAAVAGVVAVAHPVLAGEVNRVQRGK